MGDHGNPDGSEFPDDDVGESTIAMDAPPFDPNVPLPISNMPPPMPPEAAPPPVQMPRTAPVAFTPTKSSPASTPQGPNLRAKGTSGTSGLGANAKTPQAPASQPKPQPPPLGGGVAGTPSAKALRATRIGLAPPPSGVSAARPGAAAPRPPPSDRELRASPPIPPPPESGLDADSLFQLDASAADAARAAVATPARPPVSTRGEQLPRSQPKPAPVGDDDIPKMGDEADDDEAATRAVPREDYFRSQDAHVVIGTGAVGDDATLAVAPEDNDARSQRLVPFAQTMMAPEPQGAFPPPPPGTFPNPPAMQTTQPHPGGAPGWQEPPPWNPNTTPSSGSVAMAPHIPPSNPQVPIPPMGMQPMPMQGYPGQYPGQPQPGLAQRPPAAANKLPKQFIVLAVVGVVCVGIFITGIVLFATTKF